MVLFHKLLHQSYCGCGAPQERKLVTSSSLCANPPRSAARLRRSSCPTQYWLGLAPRSFRGRGGSGAFDAVWQRRLRFACLFSTCRHSTTFELLLSCSTESRSRSDFKCPDGLAICRCFCSELLKWISNGSQTTSDAQATVFATTFACLSCI